MGLPGRTPDVLRSHPPLADRLLTVRHPCHACAQRLRSARASPVLHACALPHSPPDESRHRSEEHTSELQSLMRISYAVFCLKKKNIQLRVDQSSRLDMSTIILDYLT